MVIGHNLDVIKTAEWVIDMVPEVGMTVVVTGTQEEVAKVKVSHTGRYLAKVLSGESLIGGK